MFRLLATMFLMAVGPVQEADPIPSSRFDVSGLVETLPDKTLKKLQKAPDRFIESAAGLILGFGTDGGIDLAGIDRSIAMERARVRAREMRRLMTADLDNDGAVTRAEIGALVAAERAGARGRLFLAHRAADLDGDGRVSAAELRAHAQARAMQALSESDAAHLRAFMGFDLDADGQVTLDEVIVVVQAFRQET